jgi:hypothetical protein
VPDLLAAGLEALDGARANLGRHDVLEEERPVALPVALRVGVQHPDHRRAEPAQRGGESVDVGHDGAGTRHLGRRAGRAERALHVDDHEGAARGLEAVEPAHPPAPRHHPVDDLLADGDVVHGSILP